ncbi:hypothetical protein DRQ09_09790 [candidate division KSB1 bacterium]|nr:MAG: hypothetical protein DRQ09_09790 [candidate division KSB1 bacterium]
MAISDVQPRFPAGRTGIPGDEFNNILNNHRTDRNQPVNQTRGYEQTNRLNENVIRENRLRERRPIIAIHRRGREVNMSEIITPEPLIEFNPEERVVVNSAKERVKETENFQIKQINELNAEIARGNLRRNVGPVILNPLQQDNQLGGKINTIV